MNVQREIGIDVLIRLAGPEDNADLIRLAQLEGGRPPVGRVLVAEVEGEVLAALGLGGAGGRPRVLADPFRPTAGLADLLWLRSAHLRGDQALPRPRLSKRLGGRLRGLITGPGGGSAAPGARAPASPGNGSFLIR
jgi:hypothetical protein